MKKALSEIGTLLQQKRQEAGLTQEALGQRMGVGRAQVSKIESGKPLSMTTIEKAAKALGVTISVYVEHETPGKNTVEYIIAAISEFAARHNLTQKQALNYLSMHGGISFLEENYEAEHTLSFNDCVEDLTHICRQRGGAL